MIYLSYVAAMFQEVSPKVLFITIFILLVSSGILLVLCVLLGSGSTLLGIGNRGVLGSNLLGAGRAFATHASSVDSVVQIAARITITLKDKMARINRSMHIASPIAPACNIYLAPGNTRIALGKHI